MTDTNNGYVLYVDDSADDALMAKRAFSQSHFATEFMILTDGQECIDFIFSEGEYQGKKSELPVVLLLDLNMPRLDGFDVLKRLRSEERTKHLPIVVLTTSDATKDVTRSYELGANSFVTKPIKTEDFFATIMDLDVYWSVRNTPTKPM